MNKNASIHFSIEVNSTPDDQLLFQINQSICEMLLQNGIRVGFVSTEVDNPTMGHIFRFSSIDLTQDTLSQESGYHLLDRRDDQHQRKRPLGATGEVYAYSKKAKVQEEEELLEDLKEFIALYPL